MAVDTDAYRFELHDGIASLALAGDAPHLRDAIGHVSNVLAAARAARHSRLLLDVRALRVPSPSPLDRIAMTREWAAAAGGRVVVAMVCPPYLIDPQRLGVVAAAGFGLRSGVFQHPDEALAWLREQS